MLLEDLAGTLISPTYKTIEVGLIAVSVGFYDQFEDGRVKHFIFITSNFKVEHKTRFHKAFVCVYRAVIRVPFIAHIPIFV